MDVHHAWHPRPARHGHLRPRRHGRQVPAAPAPRLEGRVVVDRRERGAPRPRGRAHRGPGAQPLAGAGQPAEGAGVVPRRGHRHVALEARPAGIHRHRPRARVEGDRRAADPRGAPPGHARYREGRARGRARRRQALHRPHRWTPFSPATTPRSTRSTPRPRRRGCASPGDPSAAPCATWATSARDRELRSLPPDLRERGYRWRDAIEREARP